MKLGGSFRSSWRSPLVFAQVLMLILLLTAAIAYGKPQGSETTETVVIIEGENTEGVAAPEATTEGGEEEEATKAASGEEATKAASGEEEATEKAATEGTDGGETRQGTGEGGEAGPIEPAPAPVITGGMDLGKLETWENFNDVESEMITMMSPNTMMIRKFEYNGDGPAAWFMVGKEKDDYAEEFADLDGVIIPDEEGNCDRLGEYKGEDIMLTLPGDMKFTDYDWFSVYCIRFSHNFGYIRLKRDEARQFNFYANTSIAAPSSSTAKPLEECDQEPEPRGENCGRNCENEERRRRKRKKGSKY